VASLDAVSERKQAIREQVGRALQEAGAARFSGAWAGSPISPGAAGACQMLAALPALKAATVVKALLSDAGLVDGRTLLVTTIHALQVLDQELPETDHDFRVDVIVTPGEVISCPRAARPAGILWDHLQAEKVAAVPVLAELASRLQRAGSRLTPP
jgi:hypothetical protein